MSHFISRPRTSIRLGACMHAYLHSHTDTAAWTQVKPDALHRRLSHSAAQVGSYLFISGGHDGSEYTPELLLFNLG